MNTANKETRQYLWQDDELVDVAPAGTWECCGEWVEKDIILHWGITDWHYVGASENGNIKTYMIRGDAYRYEMITR
jgi:hypothetical protein